VNCARARFSVLALRKRGLTAEAQSTQRARRDHPVRARQSESGRSMKLVYCDKQMITSRHEVLNLIP
jgi:hypothetical protein